LAILPVLDLMHGQVVRGVAGRREEYRPITSTLTNSAEPVAVARAFRDRFGFTALYLADLDAIAGAEPASAIYELLQKDGFQLWVDAGVRTAVDALRLRARGVNTVVVGLETVDGPQSVCAICREVGDGDLVFSLDLQNGRPLGNTIAWGADDAWSIAQRAIGEGVTRILVLDLARVGVGEGVGTEAICSRFRREYTHLEITAGGGVRGPKDVETLHAAGADQVLVASALHDGRLTREAVQSLRSAFPPRLR